MEKLIEFTPLLGRGLLVTISLALIALALATFLGALGAWAKISGRRLPVLLAKAYSTIVRGIPELVLILLVYFAGQRLINDAGRALGLGYIEISQFWAGVAAIGFIYGAYLTETFRGAWQSIPPGQSDAARALGLPAWVTVWKVLVPQFMRHAVPGYGNVWMVLVKATAVVSVIGLEDLVGLADKAGKASRQPFLFFTAVIIVYLGITSASGLILRWAETRASRGHAA